MGVMDVQEFYNMCHSPKDGKFCGRMGGGKGRFPKGSILVVRPGAQKTGPTEGRYTNVTGKGLPGHPGRGGNKAKADAVPVTGRSNGGSAGGVSRGGPKVKKSVNPEDLLDQQSAAADRAHFARKYGTKANPTAAGKALQKYAPKINKDDGLPTPKVKMTGDKRKDFIEITRLDRGSPERRAASRAFEKRYGKAKV